jgi:hypothetical protein
MDRARFVCIIHYHILPAFISAWHIIGSQQVFVEYINDSL